MVGGLVKCHEQTGLYGKGNPESGLSVHTAAEWAFLAVMVRTCYTEGNHFCVF